MPRYRIVLDNAQVTHRDDPRNFKDFADAIRPQFEKMGKKIARITNLDYPDDMGEGGPDLAAEAKAGAEVELSATGEAKAGAEVELSATAEESAKLEKKQVEPGTHTHSKLRGPKRGN